jgi:hypothetical protein
LLPRKTNQSYGGESAYQKERLRISNEQLAIAYDRFRIDSTLYMEKAIAKVTFQERQENIYATTDVAPKPIE